MTIINRCSNIITTGRVNVYARDNTAIPIRHHCATRDVTVPYQLTRYVLGRLSTSQTAVSVIQWNIPVEWEALIDLLGRHRAIAVTQKACQCGGEPLLPTGRRSPPAAPALAPALSL